MKRTILLAVTALVAFGLMAPAATADINGTGAVQGTAEFGRHFIDRFTGGPIDCRKETAKSVIARGQGLFLPPVPPAPTTNGVWSLHTTFTAVGTPPGLQSGTLDVCGWLQHVGRTSNGTAVGPSCGVSKGHSGRGQANFNPARGLNLFDLGWKAEAGGTIPMMAKYQVWNGQKPNKQKKNKWGNLLGQFQFQGGAPCLDTKNCPNQKLAGPGTPGCGAQSFVLIGTFELVQAPDGPDEDTTPAEKEDVIRPKTAPPACKDTNNALCAYDSNKFGKEPGPAFKTD